MASNKNTLLSILVLLAIGIIGFYIAWEFTADDSYITFRYSQHLSDGHGLVFNVADTDPVEGYTNFLWMLLMVIPHALGGSAVLFSKFMGMLCFLGCAHILFHYTRQKTGHVFAGVCAILPFVLLPSTYFHTVSGMETILYAALLLAAFILGYDVLTGGETTKRRLLLLPLLVFLLGMTRPEGLLPGLVTLIAVFIGIPRDSRRRFLIYCAMLLVVPGLIYFMWRMLYFGWLLPNTFYVKFGQPFDGLEWFAVSLGSLVGVIAIIILSHTLFWAENRNRVRIGLYYIAFLFLAILPYTMSNLMMNYMNRFLFHVLPVIFLILALEISDMYHRMGGGKKAAAGRWAVLVLICLSIFPLLHRDKRELAHMAMYESHLQNAHVELALALKRSSLPEPLRTLAVGDAGAIPYYSEWTSYDFVGLNDEFAAHNPAAKSDYIKTKRPSMLILYSHDGKRLNPYQFGFDPSVMSEDYATVGFIKWFPNYYLGILVRKDLEAAYYDELVTCVTDVRRGAERLNADADNRAGLLRYLKARVGW